MNITGIILSGGRGRRLGSGEKALLHIGKETLLERKIGQLKPLCAEILVVTNNPERYAGGNYRVVRDLKENIGPLMGLYSGLKNSRTEYNFITAPDMPFFNIKLWQKLKSLLCRFAGDYKVFIPRIEAGYEPLFAFYSNRCLPAIEQAIDQGGRSIYSFFEQVRVRQLNEQELRKYDPGLLSFININTGKELTAVRNQISGAGG